MHVDRDAAAIVGHRHRAVGVQRHLDPVGVAGQHLVDGVVDHLEDHVVQARAVVGVADVHAGSQPHGLEPLEHPDRGRIVDRLAGRKRAARALEGCCGPVVSGVSLMVEDRSLVDMKKAGAAVEGREETSLGAGQEDLAAERR